MILSVSAEEAFDKTQHPCMIKTFLCRKIGIPENFHNLIKGIYEKTTTTTKKEFTKYLQLALYLMVNDQNPLDSEIRHGCQCSSYSINITLKF